MNPAVLAPAWSRPASACSRRTQSALTRKNVPFPPLRAPGTGAVAWRLLAGDAGRRRTGSGQLCLRRAAVLSASGLRRWRSTGAPGGAEHGGKARHTARRGATWRRLGMRRRGALAHARRLAAHRPDHGSRAEPSGIWLGPAGNGWNARAREGRPAVARRAFGGDRSLNDLWSRGSGRLRQVFTVRGVGGLGPRSHRRRR